MLIGDCLHCPARFVATWFHGGTAAPLAEVMIREAISIESPAASVLDDLDQLAGLITADLAELARLKRLVGKVRRTVLNRLHRAQR
jgi:hypothetical protein